MPSLNYQERAARLQEVGGYLVGQGFLDTDPESKYLSTKTWKKKLPCGLWVIVLNQAYKPEPKVKISVYFPHASGNFEWKAAMEATYFGVQNPDWAARLQARLAELEKQAIEVEKIKCPYCQGYMAIRQVKKEGDHKGKTFWGCLKYPECNGIRAEWKQPSAEDDGKRLRDIKCPDCGSKMAIRYAKKGPFTGNKFYGCTAYPNCKRIVGEEEAAALRLMAEPEQDNPFAGLV
jgi:ssDNA-binding Zn-finger/Zn-ribbon topoisomerase 1